MTDSKQRKADEAEKRRQLISRRVSAACAVLAEHVQKVPKAEVERSVKIVAVTEQRAKDIRPLNVSELEKARNAAKYHKLLVHALRRNLRVYPLLQRSQRFLDALASPAQGIRKEPGKYAAAEEAAYLMDLCGLPLAKSRRGTFVNLAAALYGDRMKDGKLHPASTGMQHQCLKLLKGRTRTPKSLSGSA